MSLDSLPRLDIIFTSEDEVLNGFAMPSNNTIIWVDQNDAAIWLEKGFFTKDLCLEQVYHTDTVAKHFICIYWSNSSSGTARS